MKSVLFGWLLGLGLMASHVGCCSIRMVGDGCDMGECGGARGCDGTGSCGNLRSRIANRIRSTNCGSGCGEIYWDEQINEPPVCDPCGCNGEFECGGGGSCPSALRRLRNLWGYRYVPSNCGECSTCKTEMRGTGSSSCATCSGNTHADHAMGMQSTTPTRMISRPADESVSTRSPTPASKPIPQRAPSIAPTPVPDSNAMQWENAPAERLTVGSGVQSNVRTVKAKPVSASSKQSTQGRPRLVTNPR